MQKSNRHKNTLESYSLNTMTAVEDISGGLELMVRLKTGPVHVMYVLL